MLHTVQYQPSTAISSSVSRRTPARRLDGIIGHFNIVNTTWWWRLGHVTSASRGGIVTRVLRYRLRASAKNDGEGKVLPTPTTRHTHLAFLSSYLRTLYSLSEGEHGVARDEAATRQRCLLVTYVEIVAYVLLFPYGRRKIWYQRNHGVLDGAASPQNMRQARRGQP